MVNQVFITHMKDIFLKILHSLSLFIFIFTSMEIVEWKIKSNNAAKITKYLIMFVSTCMKK